MNPRLTHFYGINLLGDCPQKDATLSVDAKANAVMLSRYDRLSDLTLDRFVATVEAFATALVEWREWQYAADDAAVSSVVDTLVEGGLIA